MYDHPHKTNNVRTIRHSHDGRGNARWIYGLIQIANKLTNSPNNEPPGKTRGVQTFRNKPHGETKCL